MLRFQLVVILLISSFCVHAQQQAQLNQIASEVFGSKGFNGVVGIVTDSSSIALSSGFEDLKKTSPISQYTLFSLASLTKNFTAFAILEMIDAGEISDSTQLKELIGCLQAELGEVTIDQLANHTAAIADFYAIIKDERYLTNDSVRKFLCALDSTEYPSGEKWGYSNSHYFLLSEMIAETFEGRYEEAIQENYFQKMQMFTAGFIYDGAEVIPGNLDGKQTFYASRVSGEGGAAASANDMLAFGNALITNEKFKMLISKAYELSDEYVPEAGWRFGYSWFFSEDEHGKFCAFSGRGFGYNSYHRFYYENNVYYFVLSNRDEPHFKTFRNRVPEIISFSE